MVPAGLWNVLPVKVQGEIIEKPIKFQPHGSPLEILPPESHQQEEKVTKVLPVMVMVPSMFNSLRVPTAVSLLLLCLLPANPVRCRRDEKKRSPIYPRSIKESLSSPRGAALCAGGALLRLIIGRPRPRARPRPPPARPHLCPDLAAPRGSHVPHSAGLVTVPGPQPPRKKFFRLWGEPDPLASKFDPSGDFIPGPDSCISNF